LGGVDAGGKTDVVNGRIKDGCPLGMRRSCVAMSLNAKKSKGRAVCVVAGENRTVIVGDCERPSSSRG